MKKSRNKALSLALAVAVAVSAAPTTNVFAEEAKEQQYTVNMNVSYHDFYQLFGVDTMKNISSTTYTDAVSSATKNKPYMEGLNPVAYVTGDATKDATVYISGVKLPVQVSDEERKALIQAGAYQAEDFTKVSAENKAYFDAEVLEARKVVSSAAVSSDVVKLSTMYDKAVTLSNVNAGYTTMSKYGDYEFALSGEDIINTISTAVPYGVIVNTAEGDSYALYSQENIWRVSDLAWSAGVVTNAKGCELRYEPYKKSQGQTVTGFTYITNKGLYTVDIPDTKLADVKSVKDTKLSAIGGELDDLTTVTVTLSNAPTDYQVAFTYKKSGKGAVETPVKDSVKNADGTYTVKIADLMPGSYTLVASDSAIKYAQKSTSFTVAGSPVAASGATIFLNPAKGKDTIANYVSSISKVSIATGSGAAVDYVASKSGTGTIYVANIVNEDGTINLDATYTSYVAVGMGKNVTYTEVASGRVFEKGTVAAVTVTAENYDSVTTTVEVKDETIEPTVEPTVEPTTKPVTAKNQKVVIKTGNKTVTFTKLKKKAQSFTVKATAKTKVTFAKLTGNKKIVVSKAGKVTISKGLKKGTYKLKIKATAKKTAAYKEASATKNIKIVVK